MKHCKLRIAWSVGWGLAVVLLIVFWVRSYWWADQLRSRDTVAMSVLGNVRLSGAAYFYPRDRFGNGAYRIIGTNFVLYPILIERDPPTNAYRHSYVVNSSKTNVVIPYFVIVGITLFFCAGPWVKWSKQFSLRTLLIATTVVAAVLGIVAWATR